MTVAELRAAIEKLHPKRYPAFQGTTTCGCCGTRYPCPTLEALGFGVEDSARTDVGECWHCHLPIRRIAGATNDVRVRWVHTDTNSERCNSALAEPM